MFYIRARWIVAILAVCGVISYWTTGRMDPALSSVGLNYTSCVTAFGTTYCGANAERLQRNIERLQTP
jgi:hypothetical protein